MKVSEMARTKIKEFEGLRLYAYKCSGGVWTCGYGHTRGVNRLTRYSQAVAEEKFAEDISAVELSLNGFADLIGGLSQGQFDALASFVFNLGWSAFRGSTLCKTISSDKNSPMIGDLFSQWIYCKGKPLNGLRTRRQWERKRYYEK